MEGNQDDAYAPRRAELESQFHTLPSVGSGEYWQRIEEANTAQRLPLEVLARCYRERDTAGILDDANRIFNVIVERTKLKVGRWARSIASKAKSGAGSLDPEDLEQGCYMKLWKELADDGPTFLLENFEHKLDLICKHVAHSEMEKAGEWIRPGVEKPTRVPRGEIESIDAKPRNDGDPPSPSAQTVDTRAQDAFNLAEYSDLLSQSDKLPRDARIIINGLFYQGRTQEEIARELGVTDRTIRNRLKVILEEMRRRYQGGEEDSYV